MRVTIFALNCEVAGVGCGLSFFEGKLNSRGFGLAGRVFYRFWAGAEGARPSGVCQLVRVGGAAGDPYGASFSSMS